LFGEDIWLRISRWLTIAAPVFGGACNLSCLALSFYQERCQDGQFDWGFWLSPAVVISLAPLLVLFALRRLSLVVFIYACILLFILVWQAESLKEYCFGVGKFHKWDEPGVLLVFLGMISGAVFLVWAAIRLVVFLRRGSSSVKPNNDSDRPSLPK
jgi:hypothetical protein